MAPKSSRKRKFWNKRKRSKAKSVDEEDIHEENSIDNRADKKVRWESSKTEEKDSEPNEESDDETTKPEKICLAAFSTHYRVGCAYYDPIKCLIHVLEDTEETPHYDLIKMVIEQADPGIILTSSKSDDEFMDVLREYMESSGGVFQVRPAKDFSAAKGRDRLLSLRLLSEIPYETFDADGLSDATSNSEPKNAYDFMRKRRDIGGDPTSQRWNASIRVSNFTSAEVSPYCLSSVGALLDYMVRERAISELEDEGISGLEVRDIEALTLDQVMQINSDALLSLQIFENESHASIHSDKTKEGLSLFGTLNNTRTTLGRALMRNWLLRPSLSLSVINARHDAIECFLRPENLASSDAMHSHLKGIKNVPKILVAMRSGMAKVSDWQGLIKFTFHSAMLRDHLIELHQAAGVDIAKKLIAALDVASFREVGNAVNETIDWEESFSAARICVRPHIDEELDNKKHIYNGIDGVLSKVAEQISRTVPPSYTSLNIVYFPQLGFLICVPMLDEWMSERGIQLVDGWRFQFSSEGHVYCKSQEMIDMDIHIGDLHSAIIDREIEIIQVLQEKVLEFDQVMAHACDVCAELDCLLSFAEASRAYDYRRPLMVQENIIDIVQGRHPLQEQVVDTFVPNDIRVAGGAGIGSAFSPPEHNERDSEDQPEENMAWNSVVLCTGANACGKSVYLKQIALIQFMAQIGCFVSAESATLGITDKIFTRIQTRESVSRIQSAFLIDLNQVSLALRNSSARSLILLDEFGKGTVSTDGAGLFCGVLRHLLERGASCPKVLVTTHFHEVLKTNLFDPKMLPVTFVHMQVLFTSDDGDVLGEEDSSFSETDGNTRKIGPGEKITYLYRATPGLSLDSHAAKCAEIFGIPRHVVKRAQHVISLLSANELGHLLDEEMTEKERHDLEEAEKVCRRYLAWDFQDEDGKTNVKRRMAEVLGRDSDE